MTRLNLGCGTNPLTGWLNVDYDESCGPDLVHDLHNPLPFQDNTVDEILISHTLMYFTKEELANVLADCYRVLKVQGIIRITEDNVFLKYRDEEQQKQYGHGHLVSRLKMKDMMKSAGFVNVERADPFPEVPWHLNAPMFYPLPSGKEAVYFLKATKKEGPTKRTVYLTLDDFGEEVNNLDVLWKLRNHFDNFQVSLFAVPDWCGRVAFMDYIDSIGWIDLYVHGFFHLRGEELSEITLNYLTKKYFKRGYKAPMWDLSNTMYERLRKLGFKIFLQPTDSGREGIKYNWDIRNPPPDEDVLTSYGHCYLRDYPAEDPNSLERYWKNVLSLPKNTNFALYGTP